MRGLFTRPELVLHLKARAELADLQAEALRNKGENSNAQKSFAHRDAFLSILAVIDGDLLDQATTRINEKISELKK